MRSKRRDDNRSPSSTPSQVLKTSQKSNEFFAGRLLKQIEKAFSDLCCFEMMDLSFETCTDLLTYLGYCGDQLAFKDRIIGDAFKIMRAGSATGSNVSKRSFIVFINAINNVFLQWMKGGGDENSSTVNNSDFTVKSEQETAQIHYRFFALWEYRQKIKLLSSTNSTKPASTTSPLDMSFKPQTANSSIRSH